MKYKVKNNVFAAGRLNKAGTVIDINEKDEYLYKGNVEKIITEKPKKAVKP